MSPLLGDTVLFRHCFVGATGSHRVTFCRSRYPLAELEAARHRFLSASEESRWQQLRIEARRASYLLGRYCAKEAVAAHRGLGSRIDCEIRSGVFQQPVVRGPGTGGVQVSLAHSGGEAVAIAFDDDFPVGIDLEALDPDRLSVVRSQLTDRELAVLNLPGATSDPALRLGLIWTVKEALSKALKTGLTAPLPIFELNGAVWESGGLTAEFVSFTQYRAIGLALEGFALGLVFPQRFDPGCALADFRERFRFPST